MSSRDPITYHFGPYRLNPAARELWLGDELQTLAPKVLDALLWLFEHRERAVGRDELAATVWGRADVTDTQLDQLIRQLRKALGDSGSTQEFIRTVPRFGYRWVADVDLQTTDPVEPVVESIASPPAAAEPEPEFSNPSAPPEALDALAEDTPVVEEAPVPTPEPAAAPSRRSRAWLLAGLLATALVVAWFGRGFWLPKPMTTPQAAPSVAARTTPLVAVLPVTMDPHADSRHAWLRLGLMDLMSARLLEGGVQVVPAHNIIALMAGSPDKNIADRVRASTGATVIVSPSIESAEGGWRLHLDLTGVDRAVRRVDVFAQDPTQTAREAADRVLVLMGRSPVTGRLEASPDDADETSLRLNAAIASKRFDVARELLDELPEARRRSPRVRFMSAHVLLHEGHTAEALHTLEAIADAPSTEGVDDEVRASAQGGAAVVLSRLGRMNEALSRLDQAVRIAAAPRLTESFASALLNRATMHAQLGEWASADADFAQARVAMEMIGDALGLAELASNQAGMLINRQRFSEADALQAQAIDRLEQFPPGNFLLAAYGNRIALKLALLEVPSALEVAAHARATLESRMPGWPTNLMLVFHMIRADLAGGRFESARAHLDAVQPGLESATESERAMASLMRGLLELETGGLKEAREFASRAYTVYAQPRLAKIHQRARSGSALVLVKASLAEDRVDKASADLTRFEGWARDSTDEVVSAHLALGRALVAARGDDVQRAVRLFEKGLEAALPAAPATVAQVAIEYGHFLIEHDDLDGAARVIGRIAPWAPTDYRCALAQAELYQALGQVDAWRRSMNESRTLAGQRAIPAGLEREPRPAARARTLADHPGGLPPA